MRTDHAHPVLICENGALDVINRPRVTKPNPWTLDRRPWAVEYPVNGRTFTAWFPVWRDALRFACNLASTSKVKT